MYKSNLIKCTFITTNIITLHIAVSSVEPVEAAHVSVLVPVDQLAVVPDELTPGAGAGVRRIENAPSCVILLW